MEFHEKLQALRRQKGISQEALAGELFVSRTAISKWETGRGYPGIESLSAISRYFSVPIDDLLSGEELMSAAKEEQKEKRTQDRDRIFGLLDVGIAALLVLPFFGYQVGEQIYEIGLLELPKYDPHRYLLIPYFAIVCAIILCGIVTLTLQSSASPLWKKCRGRLSLGLSAFGALLFMVSNQPYAAALTFLFLAIKAGFLLEKA